MWGLLERTVAVECLGTVAGELKKSKADLQSLLPASEYSALETFFSRTVEAAGTSPYCTHHPLYAPLPVIPPYNITFFTPIVACCIKGYVLHEWTADSRVTISFGRQWHGA